MLTQEFIERLIRSERKEVLLAAVRLCDKKIKRLIKKRIFPSASSVVSMLKDSSFFSPKYERELRGFLESYDWMIFFFLHSSIFRFLLILGMEDDILLSVFLFLSDLNYSQRRLFFSKLFERICEKGKTIEQTIGTRLQRIRQKD